MEQQTVSKEKEKEKATFQREKCFAML